MSLKMIERVAKAINLHLTTIGHNLEHIDLGPSLAKAAIAAMRNPTDDMCFAASGSHHQDDLNVMKESYQLMIDVALKE